RLRRSPDAPVLAAGVSPRSWRILRRYAIRSLEPAMASSTEPPTFVLLHGPLCDGQPWAHLIGPLSRLGPVFVPRLSGLRWVPEAAARTLAQTHGPLVVIGHSMGGRIAFEMARQAPERCAALVLMNTGYRGLGDGEAPRRMAQVEAARKGGIEAIVDTWLDG